MRKVDNPPYLNQKDIEDFANEFWVNIIVITSSVWLVTMGFEDPQHYMNKALLDVEKMRKEQTPNSHKKAT